MWKDDRVWRKSLLLSQQMSTEPDELKRWVMLGRCTWENGAIVALFRVVAWLMSLQCAIDRVPANAALCVVTQLRTLKGNAEAKQLPTCRWKAGSTSRCSENRRRNSSSLLIFVFSSLCNAGISEASLSYQHFQVTMDLNFSTRPNISLRPIVLIFCSFLLQKFLYTFHSSCFFFLTSRKQIYCQIPSGYIAATASLTDYASKFSTKAKINIAPM